MGRHSKSRFAALDLGRASRVTRGPMGPLVDFSLGQPKTGLDRE